jgi:hypothetical protein
MKNTKKAQANKNIIAITLGAAALVLALVALWLSITNMQILRTSMEMEAEDDFQRAVRQSRYELCYEHSIKPCVKTDAARVD